MDAKLRLTVGAIKGSLLGSTGLVQALLVSALVLLNQGFNVAATIGIARSGLAETMAAFVGWQIVGSVFGLGTQVTFAGMVRFFSLRFANSVGIGLAFVSAQIFSAYVLLHEPFSIVQWIGTGLIFLGILFIALGH